MSRLRQDLRFLFCWHDADRRDCKLFSIDEFQSAQVSWLWQRVERRQRRQRQRATASLHSFRDGAHAAKLRVYFRSSPAVFVDSLELPGG